MISVAKPFSTRTPSRAAWLLSSFLALVFLGGCSASKPEPVTLTGLTMGTSYHITIADTVDAAVIQQQVDQRLRQLNQIFSTYIDDSELSLLNRAAVGVWHRLDPELHGLLERSQRISEQTSGAFDITVGPLVNAWGFGPDISTRAPADEVLDQLKKRVGYQYLELTEKAVKKHRDLYIDLSAVAKGYAVDQIAQLLVGHQLQNFMVEIGGELYLQGNSPREAPWRIAIEQPGEQLAQVHRAIEVSGVAVATSGDYRNYYEVDGKRFSHTIDARTGKPVTHKLASVTVIADSCAEADALATAINVLGVEEGLAKAAQYGWAIYLISKHGDAFISQYSDAFTPYLQ
jgi:thiamine biosynthesis lipoprotein